jgi:hypothetical protein
MKIAAKANSTTRIDNPADTMQELVIESGNTEFASSGDIAPGSSEKQTRYYDIPVSSTYLIFQLRKVMK